jgi:FKBP-type peptidyl-prolyl cis-trans isomerase 2
MMFYFLPLLQLTAYSAAFAFTNHGNAVVRRAWVSRPVSLSTPRSLKMFMSLLNDTSTSTTEITTTKAPPRTGSVVTIECCLCPEGDFVPETLFDGICVEAWDKPKTLSFVLGEGNYLPGLHELVSTMTVGMSTEAFLDAGWGGRNPNLEAWIPFKDVAVDQKSKIKEGTELVLANGLNALVTQVTDDKFKIDANPPLAGASYKASVKLLQVEEGPVETVYPADKKSSSSRFEVATIALGTCTLNIHGWIC